MGLLDNECTLLDPERDKIIIKEWIDANYVVYGRLDISDDFIVDCTGEVTVKNNNITSFTNNLFKWGSVLGFYCNGCSNLTSLKGAPTEVKEDFCCSFCDHLESLEGAPKRCGWFDCNTCASLTDLIGAPNKIDTSFICDHCMGLKSLKGGPEWVGGDFVCTYCENLKTLEGAPKFIRGNICCNNCKNLKIVPTVFRNYKVLY